MGLWAGYGAPLMDCGNSPVRWPLKVIGSARASRGHMISRLYFPLFFRFYFILLFNGFFNQSWDSLKVSFSKCRQFQEVSFRIRGGHLAKRTNPGSFL